MVEPFVESTTDQLPDGRIFGGDRVGDLRGEHGHATLQAPNGAMQDVDLSAYGEDERVRITWENMSAQRLKELRSS